MTGMFGWTQRARLNWLHRRTDFKESARTPDNKTMPPSREVGRFDNGESLVATG